MERRLEKGKTKRDLNLQGGIQLDGGGDNNRAGRGGFTQSGREKKVVGERGGKEKVKAVRRRAEDFAGFPSQAGGERSGRVAKRRKTGREKLLPEAVEAEQSTQHGEVTAGRKRGEKGAEIGGSRPR